MKRLVVTLTLVLTLLAQIVPVASLPAAAAEIEWTASITGSITVAGTTYTDPFTAAVATGTDVSSGSDYDLVDIENPPPPSEGYLDLYSRLGSNRFMRDVRLPTPPIVWTIKVATDMEGSATLTWDVSEVPASYTLSLKDEGTGTIIDPRISGLYTFSISAETRTFTLAASAADVNSPPTITSLYPPGGEIVSDTINMQAQATDADGTVQSVEFEYSHDWGDTWFTIDTDTDGSDGWSIPWNTTSVADGTYYLIQATAIDNLGATGSGQSDEVFSVDNTAPAAPVLVSPLATTAETPAFAWSEVTDPAGVAYTLEIDNDPDLSSPLIVKPGLTLTELALAAAEALGEGTYYWAVRAADIVGNESPWSDIGQFTVVDTTAPEAPDLVSPAHLTVTTDSTPTLDWTDVADPSGASYTLEMDNNADFSSPEITTEVDSSTYTPSAALADGTYYWWVKAVDGADNESPWSTTWSFLVDTTAPAVTITPLAQEVIQDNILTFSGSAADAATAVDSVEYRLNGGNWIAAQAVDGAFDELSEDYTFTTPSLTEGPYIVEARATDTAGNTTPATSYARIVFVIIPPQVSAGSVVTLSVSNQVPPPVNAIAEADTELVFSSDTGAVTGVVMVAKYTQEPLLPTTFSVGTATTPLKFIDVKATFATTTSPGKVTVKIHYTDAELTAAGLGELSLKIYYWDGNSWEESTNNSLDRENNVVSGDVPVSALSGTPLGLGGLPPVAVSPIIWVVGGALLLLMILIYLRLRRRPQE